jgi:hypothetical protein
MLCASDGLVPDEPKRIGRVTRHDHGGCRATFHFFNLQEPSMRYTPRWTPRLIFAALAALAAVAAAPAHADLAASCAAMTTAEPCFTYTGDVFRHGRSTYATDLVAGTPVTFTLEYNPTQVTDFGLKMLTDADGNAIDVHPLGVTIANGAFVDYEITAGSHTWSYSADGENPNPPNPNGVDPHPLVAFDGTPNPYILGIESDITNSESLELTSQPGDVLLDYLSDVVTILDPDGHLVALIDTSLDGNIQAARAEDLAAAQVPEPSSWALLMLGGVALCVVSRVRSTRGRMPIGRFA